jgi:amino acid transporter
MYIAAWSTYGFETAVCYTSRAERPQARYLPGDLLLGPTVHRLLLPDPLLVPRGSGARRHAGAGIVDGTGVGEAMGNMIGGGPVFTQIFVILMIMALFLAIMTAMAGSSRTLYQGSRDGWLPKYLGTNSHGAPRNAMWTDFAFNVILLALASDVGGYFYVLAISNVGYIMFNFLNLNAGWIHRIDSAHMERPVEGADLADRAEHRSGLRQRVVPWRRGQGLGL